MPVLAETAIKTGLKINKNNVKVKSREWCSLQLVQGLIIFVTLSPDG